MRGTAPILALGACTLLGAARVAAQPDPAAAPPGPYLPLADAARLPASFKTGERFVATYYFYWYDVVSSAHLLDADGSDALQDHPPTLDGFSYQDPLWHRAQLLDMIDAGIDVLLPVFWGVPGRSDDWNCIGLRALVAARQALLTEGKRPPRIGLFYDTTTLDRVDLTAEAGRIQFCRTVRDFFSLVPPEDWALLDGRPLVWLYSSHWPRAVDARAFAELRAGLARDCAGREPFVIGDRGWERRAGGAVLDARYQWGAALAGPRLDGRIAAIGPGYNDSAVPGRSTPVRDREDGRFYERACRVALLSDAEIAVVETWNEFHEGTDVCASKEYGRAYIDATRRFADAFRRHEQPTRQAG
ncbi:MAG: hypothetical protein HZA54_12635, partial [Planctomycetes bacterium]|nr:hypothetical protein [Planctomycetota bacterium]